MLKDKINRNLLGILIVLALTYVVSLSLKRGSSGSAVLTQDLFQVDTAQITKILIEKQGDQIQLSKAGNSWSITPNNGTEVPALSPRVHSLLDALLRISPSRIVSQRPDQWRDYQVDSTGQRVQLFQGPKKSMDLIIGRGSMQDQRTFITYVRPKDENTVYVIENFSGSSVSTNASNYRNKTVLNATVDSIQQIIFNYPNDNDFVLMRMKNEWQINGVPADSARVADYLNGLGRVTSTQFADQYPLALNNPPASSMTIQTNTSPDIIIELYRAEDGKQILHSSQNPNNNFADTAVINKLFVRSVEFK